MRVRLILIGIGLIIFGTVLASVLAFATWGNPTEYWTGVGEYAVGGGVGSTKSFETYLSAGYYALSASGGAPGNYSWNQTVVIMPLGEGRLSQTRYITSNTPVYFQISYDDTYTFYFFNWDPAVATISKRMYQGVISYSNLSPTGVLIALVGLIFLIAGAILTAPPSRPSSRSRRNALIRLKQSRYFTILHHLNSRG